MKIEKPPVISDEQFSKWCQSHQKQCNFECGTRGTLLCRLEAQRDADAAYYEPIIRGLKADIEAYSHAVEVLSKHPGGKDRVKEGK